MRLQPVFHTVTGAGIGLKSIWLQPLLHTVTASIKHGYSLITYGYSLHYIRLQSVLHTVTQLVRPFGAPPFTDDDSYLGELLAPHLAHALSRTQAVDARKVTSEQYQHILRTAQTLGTEESSEASSDQVAGSPGTQRRLSMEVEPSSPGALQLAPTALAAPSYGVETVRSAMRRLFACDEVLVYMPRDPAAVLKACERGSLQKAGGTLQQLALYDRMVEEAGSNKQLAANGNKAGGDSLSKSREMVPLQLEESKPHTGLASVSGLEELCISGDSLVLVAPGEGQRKQSAAGRLFARNLDAVGKSNRTPVRSMLCVPALLHRDAIEEVLGDSVGTYLSAAKIEGDPDPLVPCLLQWVNRHDAPFTPPDKRSAAMLAQLVTRAGQTRRTQQATKQMQERWVSGDAQKKALMAASKMLAQHLDMKELFSGVMIKAKELLEVDRSTLFLVSAAKVSTNT